MARPMTDEELSAIAARADAALMEPWETGDGNGNTDGIVWSGDFRVANTYGHEANADFIAHARQDVPALLDEVMQRRSDVARLTAAVQVLRARTNAQAPIDSVGKRC